MPKISWEQSSSHAAATTPLLLDISGSMSEAVGNRRRIDVLDDTLRHLLPTLPGARLIAFSASERSSRARRCRNQAAAPTSPRR
jgi:hypothetical protein